MDLLAFFCQPLRSESMRGLAVGTGLPKASRTMLRNAQQVPARHKEDDNLGCGCASWGE